MACENALWHVDALTIDGVALAIGDSSAVIEGLAGFENEAKPAAGAGETKTMRKKIATIIKAKLQMMDPAQTESLSQACSAQIVLRDAKLEKRVMFTKCSFAKMGEVGKDEVDIEWIANTPAVYL